MISILSAPMLRNDPTIVSSQVHERQHSTYLMYCPSYPVAALTLLVHEQLTIIVILTPKTNLHKLLQTDATLWYNKGPQTDDWVKIGGECDQARKP